jgi:hypothetical protein
MEQKPQPSGIEAESVAHRPRCNNDRARCAGQCVKRLGSIDPDLYWGKAVGPCSGESVSETLKGIGSRAHDRRRDGTQ